ncbi:MAG TPA: DUF1254 domain-containing protein [Candidatus Cybelea sp.]|jgi:hypothetical protein|nr:DUF1254 domain-containing protein [Candidatus Cybelea sp.]
MKLFRVLVLAAAATAISSPIRAQTVSPSQVQSIAQQAYVYGFPMIDLYRIVFGYFIDSKTPAFQAPFNTLHNSANVYTPADKTIQTPNSDTPYSFVGLDLRAEPLVLTMPPIEKKRYYSAQFVDLYTFNIAYAGTRTTGNGGTKVLIAGPGWKGTAPSGITKVVRFDTQFGLVGIRTQLFGPSDLAKLREIQAGYSAVPLSAYVRAPRPAAAPAVKWIAPLSPAMERTSPQGFNILAFLLQFCPVDPSETALRASFAKIGIIPGKPFDPDGMTAAYAAGIGAGQKEIDAKRATVTSANDLFGTRAQMKNDFLNRAVAAQYGILGNSAAEAVYMPWPRTSDGKTPNGNVPATIHFAKGQLPPVRAFWSVTMYDLPKQLLVANPINRYLINSSMLSTLKRDADGGLTLYIQHKSPGGTKAANWLPAPAGPYLLFLRMYWPEQSAIDGTWKQPPLLNTP